jgi:DNA polymerase III epsilon subunit family exonuclease
MMGASPDIKMQIARENRGKVDQLDRDGFVAIDIETTGLMAHRGDRVIEIGAVMLPVTGGAQEFHSLINVKKRISLNAGLIHGVTNDLLSDQPRAEDVFPRFKEFIGSSTLVAHNASFDIGFLRYEFSRLGQAFNNRHICTLEMSKTSLPRLRNYCLETVYRFLFGRLPEGEQRHRAMGDARMVAEIWREMRGR